MWTSGVMWPMPAVFLYTSRIFCFLLSVFCLMILVVSNDLARLENDSCDWIVEGAYKSNWLYSLSWHINWGVVKAYGGLWLSSIWLNQWWAANRNTSNQLSLGRSKKERWTDLLGQNAQKQGPRSRQYFSGKWPKLPHKPGLKGAQRGWKLIRTGAGKNFGCLFSKAWKCGSVNKVRI